MTESRGVPSNVLSYFTYMYLLLVLRHEANKELLLGTPLSGYSTVKRHCSVSSWFLSMAHFLIRPHSLTRRYLHLYIM